MTATLRQLGRGRWGAQEQAWVAHRLGGVMPSLVPNHWGYDQTLHGRLPLSEEQSAAR
jgi:hypothetical protein